MPVQRLCVVLAEDVAHWPDFRHWLPARAALDAVAVVQLLFCERIGHRLFLAAVTRHAEFAVWVDRHSHVMHDVFSGAAFGSAHNQDVMVRPVFARQPGTLFILIVRQVELRGGG